MDTQKTQILDRLQQATNILVTVSANPSVDQLSAAIGLTLLLNHQGKHATAVFSGQVPSTIEFLQPEKTLEKNTDSLRDFIIALDKSKADKLRYKVEDQMVKIFITPYRTSISDKDLEFSQGDFNVEVVLALGVREQADLDQAITAHGRILHDATVIGLSTDAANALGSINWNNANASSLCEMVVSLGLTMKADALDAQMATALLTGIVAETERFSNEKTSSETMQISAKLMTAGANQQLVASQLEKPEQLEEPTSAKVPETPEPAEIIADPIADAPAELPELTPLEGESAEAEPPEVLLDTPPVAEKAASDGSLQIDHGEPKVVTDPDPFGEPEEPEVEQIHIDDEGLLQTTAQVNQMKQKVIQPLPTTEKEEPKADSRLVLEPPTLGGKLTANTEPEALDPSNDPLGEQIATGPMLSHEDDESNPPPVPVSSSPTTLSDLEQAVASPHAVEDAQPAPPEVEDVDAARDAVQNAVAGTVASVLEPVQALNAQPMDLNLDPQLATPPIVVEPSAVDTTASDPGLPPGLVPIDRGLPADNTATSVTDPTAPPTVPPPMMPPTVPQVEVSKPSDTAL